MNRIFAMLALPLMALLATQIRAEHDPEITQMKRWLADRDASSSGREMAARRRTE